MIKKLINQPYAPEWEQAPKVEQEEEKNCRTKFIAASFVLEFVYEQSVQATPEASYF
jgi:hypothetical protein